MTDETKKRGRFFGIDKIVVLLLVCVPVYEYFYKTSCYDSYNRFQEKMYITYAALSIILYLFGSFCVVWGGGSRSSSSSFTIVGNSITRDSAPASFLAWIGYLISYLGFAALLATAWFSFGHSDYLSRLPDGSCKPAPEQGPAPQ